MLSVTDILIHQPLAALNDSDAISSWYLKRVIGKTYACFAVATHAIDTAVCLTRSLLHLVTCNFAGCKKTSQYAAKHFTAVFTTIPGIYNQPEAMCIALPIESCETLPKRGLTYQMYPLSRLGDNLSTYARAKWLSEKYDLPLIVKGYPAFNNLQLMKNAKYSIPSQERAARLGVPFTIQAFEQNSDKEVIWEKPFMSDALIEEGFLDDEDFRARLEADLQPAVEMDLPELKDDRLNIALHLRTGGGFDMENAHLIWPDKIPPTTCYQQMIQYVLEEYKNEPLHIEIFTDSLNPAELTTFYTAFATKHHHNVTVHSAASSGSQEAHAAKDLISMMRYPVIIKPASGLSGMAVKLGGIQREITVPINAGRVENDIAYIDTAQDNRREIAPDGSIIKTSKEITLIPDS